MQKSDLFRTIVSWILFIPFCILYFIPFFIFLLLPKKWFYTSSIFFWFTDVFYKYILRFSFLPITIIGKENLLDSPSIFVANHQSSLDIPLMGALLNKHPHIWLAKKELESNIILRLILPRIAVLVDMSTPQKGMRSLIEAINVANGHNVHIIIFPEGGRFTDGTVHDFFSGFVILAKKTGRPVIPVYIQGVEKAYPPTGHIIHKLPIKVVIGKPMVYQEEDGEQAFKDLVYNWFLAQQEA